MFSATQTARHVSSRQLGRLFLTGTSLMALAGSALAADLPLVKAPPPAIAASWAGFYLGVHGGYGWKRDDFSVPANFDFQTDTRIDGIRSKGAVYGAQAGYNWQYGRAVTGLEIDFSASDIKGSNGAGGSRVTSDFTLSSTDTLGERVRYLGSARARLGWLPTDKVLLYGTAGLAWERLDQTELTMLLPGPEGSSQQFLRQPIDKFGWVAGVGAEVMLGSPNWIGRLEYLHYDLGQINTASSSGAIGGPAIVTTAGSQTIDVVRAGVSYKFGEPARVAPVAYTKAPVAAPLSSWAGFYLGGHGGYGWADDPGALPLALLGPNDTPGSITGTQSKGWVAGGQFGHNWQYDRVVSGFEIDLSAADIKGHTNTGIIAAESSTVAATLDEKIKYLGTMRGRLGWLPTDNLLIYGTAGLAWERVERGSITVDQIPGLGTTNARSVIPSDHFGWVAGVGGEMMLGSPNWIGRLEYLHYDFGRINSELSFSTTRSGQITTAAALTAGRQTIDLLRAGVSYKFGPEFAAAAAPAIFTKAPRMAPPLQTWAGFYLGGHGGYGWKDNDFSTNFATGLLSPAVFEGGIKSRGWLGGGQAGYNWQYTNVVAGLEIDGTATGIKGSSVPATALDSDSGTFLTETLTDKVKYLGTARGRLGWTPAGNWLLYGTGGLAWERVNRSLLDATTTAPISIFSQETPLDHFGWVAGAGVETFIGSSNWIARLEYLHYDFGTVEPTTAQTSSVPGVQNFADKGGRQTIETVRAGVSYKFAP